MLDATVENIAEVGPCRLMGMLVTQVIGCATICWAVYEIYFGAIFLETCDSAAEAQNRSDAHRQLLVGLLPALSRTVLTGGAVFAAGWLCKRAGLLPENAAAGGGIGKALLLGAGEHDGGAENAGWLAIAGNAGAQSTWAGARDARGLTERQAKTAAFFKLVFWHWSQPGAYLWLLGSYRCYITALGSTQQYLASVIAMREMIYLGTTVLATSNCPVFLLLDPKTVWNEARTTLERFTWMTMYGLCPHNFVAIVLSKRFPYWKAFFLCLAAVQVLADISSCYALANLIASSTKQTTPSGTVGDNSSATGAKCVLKPGSAVGFAQACLALSDNEANCQALGDHCLWTGDISTETGPLQVGYGITAFGFLLFFGPLSIATNLEAAMDKQRHRALRVVRGVASGSLFLAWVAIMVLMGWLLLGGNPFCSGLPFLDFSCSGNGQCVGAGGCHCDAGFGPESKSSGTDLCSCPVGFIDGNGHCDHSTGCDGPKNDCSIHGDCVANGVDRTCSCKGEWSGITCAEDPCKTQDCNSHGVCNVHGETHTCACDVGWIGITCDHPTGCDTEPCGVHAKNCSAYGRDYNCTCLAGWHGDTCEYAMGCNSDPCLHGGTCSATGEYHVCLCASGWSGDQDCSQPILGFQRIDSHIMGATTTGLQFIEDALPNGSKSKQWALCFDSRTDCTTCPSTALFDRGYRARCYDSSQRTFHGGCDTFNGTLVLGHNSLGYTFGGLAMGTWGGNGYCRTQACSEDFLFRLGPGAAALYRPRAGGLVRTDYEYDWDWPTRYHMSGPEYWPKWGGDDLDFGTFGPVGGHGGGTEDANCNGLGNTYEGLGLTGAELRNDVCGGPRGGRGVEWGATEMEVWYRVGVCVHGWSGDSCDHPTGCDGDPCQHGGTCTADGGSHSCACAPSWGGPDCLEHDGLWKVSSHIINATVDGLRLIEDALPKDLQGKQWALCYDSRTDCTSCPSATASLRPCSCTDSSQRTFHGGCDAHAETVVLGHNSLGYTFGGLALTSWGGTSMCCSSLTAIENDCRTEVCSGNFLFRLGPGVAMVYRPRLVGGYQGREPACWPFWGEGSDLSFGKCGDALGVAAYCTQRTYEGGGQRGKEVCGGGTGDGDGDMWGATEMEVWYRAN
eukprot:SAG11_NODE_944_length_6433_cov_3.988949_4_plen_1128_part_00